MHGNVILTLHRKGDPEPEIGGIELKFSCLSDREGTVQSAKEEMVDRILEMF